MTRNTLAVALLAAVTACGGTEPLQPTLDDLPLAMAPTSNNGNGVQFGLITGPAILGSMGDLDGNICTVGFSAQPGGKGRSDFFRLNKDGTQTIHTTDSNAPLEVLYGGELYTGVGHAVASGTTNEAFTAYRNLTFTARGPVTNGLGESFRADCKLILQNSVDFTAGTITVK